MFIIIEVLNCFLSIPFSLLRYTYLGFTTLCLSLDLCIVTWTVLVCTWAPGNALRGPDGMTSFHETLSLLKEEQMSIYYAFVASSNLLQWLSMAFIFKNLLQSFVIFVSIWVPTVFAWIHWISPCRWQDLEFAGEHYRLFWFLLLPLVGLPIWVNYQSDRDQRVAACTGSPLALPLQSGTPGRDDFLSVGIWWSCMVSDGICNIMTHYDPLVQYEPVTSPQSLFTRKQCMQ